jgi:hypothetical protein
MKAMLKIVILLLLLNIVAITILVLFNNQGLSEAKSLLVLRGQNSLPKVFDNSPYEPWEESKLWKLYLAKIEKALPYQNLRLANSSDYCSKRK